MKIETKFSIGDKVYFMFNNEVRRGVIVSIIIRINNKDERTFTYQIDGVHGMIFSDANLYGTKEEIIKALFETAIEADFTEESTF